MTILYAPPPAAGPHVISWLECDGAPVAEGPEGRHVQDNLNEAIRHWNLRTEQVLREQEHDDVPVIAYRHVPFQRVATVRLRYASPRTLQPRRLVPDDPDA